MHVALVMFLAEKDFLSLKNKKFMMKQILHPFNRHFVPDLKQFAHVHVHSVHFIHSYKIRFSAPTGRVISQCDR